VTSQPRTARFEDSAVNLGLRSGAGVHLGDLETAIELARQSRTFADRKAATRLADVLDGEQLTLRLLREAMADSAPEL
jgi:hypothetical protein